MAASMSASMDDTASVGGREEKNACPPDRFHSPGALMATQEPVELTTSKLFFLVSHLVG